jgi:D-alanyl-D-alanine carboxypeptidase
MKLGPENLRSKPVQIGSAVALSLLASYVIYADVDLRRERGALLAEKSRLQTELGSLKAERDSLQDLARDQKEVIDAFAPTIDNISGTVGDLQKLANTDEELLKKYSKVYFLNENYVPSKLTEIDKQYLFGQGSNLLIHGDVWPYLKDLLEDANDNGIKLRIASAFRSFDAQASLKAGYTVVYGSGANQFSADQGYSEHQLGTTVDFTTPAVGGVFDSFEKDPAYKWLNENAYKYGFVLSYPKNNSYYKFEPWHWRFVGTDLAKDLHNENKHFYDLDQRDIDKYLISIFE